MGDEIRVTVIATGFDHGRARPRAAREERPRAAAATAAPRIDERQRVLARDLATTISTSRRSCADAAAPTPGAESSGSRPMTP